MYTEKGSSAQPWIERINVLKKQYYYYNYYYYYYYSLIEFAYKTKMVKQNALELPVSFFCHTFLEYRAIRSKEIFYRPLTK